MKQILVYGDSISWGVIPGTRNRLEFHERWLGVMENILNAEQPNTVRILDNCINGRRTVWEDPFKVGRNGLTGIEQVIEMHSPLALAIVFLGTNDFQSMHPHNAWHAGQGMRTLITSIRQAPVEPGMPIPPILMIAPPPIKNPQGVMAMKFLNGEEKCVGLAKEYQLVAEEMGCHLFDSASVISVSPVDGIHVSKEDHMILGKAIAEQVKTILA